MADLTKEYIIKDVIYDDAVHEQEGLQKLADASKKEVDDSTYATMTTCDAKAGVKHEEWDDASCEGTSAKKFEYEWGSCVKAPDGENYIKITGAAALQAAAVALVAFAGSQF